MHTSVPAFVVRSQAGIEKEVDPTGVSGVVGLYHGDMARAQRTRLVLTGNEGMSHVIKADLPPSKARWECADPH